MWTKIGFRNRTVWGGRMDIAIRWLIGIVFIYSGMTKLLNPAHFEMIINDYGLLPDSWARTAAIVLAGLEAAAGFGLIRNINAGLNAVAGLMVLFMAILSYGMWLGLDIDCGCFGPNDPETAVYGGLRSALYRDILMMAGILFLYWRRFRMNMEGVFR